MQQDARLTAFVGLPVQEELDLQPGHRFLDVGSGCGILTACGALLVRHTACLQSRAPCPLSVLKARGGLGVGEDSPFPFSLN